MVLRCCSHSVIWSTSLEACIDRCVPYEKFCNVASFGPIFIIAQTWLQLFLLAWFKRSLRFLLKKLLHRKLSVSSWLTVLSKEHCQRSGQICSLALLTVSMTKLAPIFYPQRAYVVSLYGTGMLAMWRVLRIFLYSIFQRQTFPLIRSMSVYWGLLYRTNWCAFDKCCSHVKEVLCSLLVQKRHVYSITWGILSFVVYD